MAEIVVVTAEPLRAKRVRARARLRARARFFLNELNEI